MKSTLNTWIAFSILAVAVFGIGTRQAEAAMIADDNVFRDESTAATSTYSGAFPDSNAVDSVDVDGANNSPYSHFVFSDENDLVRALQIFGFSSSIDTIRFFGPDLDPYVERTSDGVHIYYSTTINAVDLNPANYTDLGQFALPVVDQEYQFASASATEPNYAELSGLGIPGGTQSILLLFNVSTVNLRTGVAFTEIQAFVPEPTTFSLASFGCSCIWLWSAARRRSV